MKKLKFLFLSQILVAVDLESRVHAGQKFVFL